MYIQIILFLSFSSISVSFALCLAFGAKIKSVIEPDGVENLSFRFKKLHRPESFTEPCVSEIIIIQSMTPTGDIASIRPLISQYTVRIH